MKKSFVLPAVLLCAAMAAFAGPYDTWRKYRTITVNTTTAGVTTTQANFPLLVRLTNVADSTGANVLSGALSNGADIRFTDSTGQTALSYQIDTWGPTSAAVWVKVPSIAGSAVTKVRLYWGKTGSADSSKGSAVFDTAAGFTNVWHLGNADSTAPRPNAITGGNPAVPTSFPAGYTPKTGIIGKADSLRGGSPGTDGVNTASLDHLDLGSNTINYSLGFTFSIWVYQVRAGNNTDFYMASSSSTATAPNGLIIAGLISNSGGGAKFRQRNVGTDGNIGINNTSGTEMNAAALNNQWRHFVFTKNPAGTSNGSMIVYMDGVQIATNNPTSTGGTATPNNFSTTTRAQNWLGAGHPGLKYLDSSFAGLMDEARLANVTRSADWAKLEFQTQKAVPAAVNLGATTTQVAGPYDAWANSRAITLNTSATGANVAGNVTNFPVLVRLGSAEAAIFTQAKAAGADIRFSKNDETALPYQIERWNSTLNRAEIWVKVDTVFGNNTSQSIKMYWGNSAATSQSNGSAVYDTANGYASAWHLGDTTGVAPRPNAIAGRFAAKPVSFAAGYQPKQGVIGLADSLTGGSNADSTTFLAINEGTPSTYFNFPNGKFTYTAWINPTAADNFGRLISLVSDNGTSGTNRIFFSFNGGNIIGRVGVGTASNAINSTTPPLLGEWQHVAMVTNRGTSVDTTRLYLNGAQIAQATHNPMPNAARDYVRIGKDYINPPSDLTYNGKIDEANISTVNRSADFIKLSYMSQGTYQKLTNIGVAVPSAPDAPTGVVAVAGAAGSGQATVTWSAPASNGSAITSYVVRAVTDSSKTCTATAGALTCVVTGLPNATSFTFTVKAINGAGTSAASAPSNAISIATGIRNAFAFHVTGGSRPYSFSLSQAELGSTESLTLSISDVYGRTVWSKTVNPARDNVREIAWNGKSANGMQASAGMYMVRISARSGGKTTDLVQKSIALKPVK